MKRPWQLILHAYYMSVKNCLAILFTFHILFFKFGFVFFHFILQSTGKIIKMLFSLTWYSSILDIEVFQRNCEMERFEEMCLRELSYFRNYILPTHNRKLYISSFTRFINWIIFLIKLWKQKNISNERNSTIVSVVFCCIWYSML